ncbi:MAG: sugar ABC transporter permease [Angelakisella sp.]
MLSSKNRNKLIPYLFVGPAILYFASVTLIPALMALPISFTNWSITNPKPRFVGFSNYQLLFQDPMFFETTWNTICMASYIPLVLALGLLLALLVNAKSFGNVIYRVTFYAPVVTSTIAAAIVFEWLYDPSFGLLNSILGAFGISGIGWVKDPNTSLMSVILFKLWKGAGAIMIIYLAGLQDIPTELYESAALDGASNTKAFFRITLPLLRPQHIYLLMTQTIGLFMIFQETYILDGPLDSTKTIVNYIYTEGFKNMRMGYASAMSMILFVLVLVLAVAQKKIVKLDTV